MTDYSGVMPTKSKKSKRKGGALAFACWALGFLIIVIIFLVKLDDIKSNLKQTNFFERLFGKTPTFMQQYEDKRHPVQEEPLVEETFVATDAPQTPVSPISSLLDADDEPYTPSTPLPPSATELSDALMATDDRSVIEARAAEAAATSDAVPQAPAGTGEREQVQNFVTTEAKLWFVTIDGDGSVVCKEVTRMIKKSGAPLTENIKLLLAGPTQTERNKGYRSLIPEGTRLLSATVRDGTAQLNFSEEFEYNQSFGADGYLGQLKQVVYTATAFPTVTNVQFLIEGQKKEFLGSEGVWIGSPHTRTSLR